MHKLDYTHCKELSALINKTMIFLSLLDIFRLMYADTIETQWIGNYYIQLAKVISSVATTTTNSRLKLTNEVD
jgi:hypothetical protein